MTIEAGSESALEKLSGYNTEDAYLATRYIQGGRHVYTTDLSIDQLVATLPRPDPVQRLQGNRKITPAHARAFSAYVRARKDGIVPPLLLRCPEAVIEFEPLQEVGGSELGILRIRRYAREDIRIIDGQHRILGFHMAWRALASDIDKARSELAKAQRMGSEALGRAARQQLDRLEEQRARVGSDRVSMHIIVVDDQQEYQQIFVDIADNAKGISKTTRALFDSTKIVHRCLDDVMQHPLLLERVDLDRDLITGSNNNLMGAKHVADIIRIVEVGIRGRISARLESELIEDHLIDQAKVFLDVVVDGFPDLASVASGDLLTPDLRKRSLLGSVSMHRILAGAYHELTSDKNGPPRMNRLQVQWFFERLAAYMNAPVTDDSPWRRLTRVFQADAMTPPGGAGQSRQVVDVIVGWSLSQPQWFINARMPGEDVWAQEPDEHLDSGVGAEGAGADDSPA